MSQPLPADDLPAVRPYRAVPPGLPTQTGPAGIRYDFNDGARILLPPGDWHVELSDADTGNLLFTTDTREGWVLSGKKFLVRFVLRVWVKGEPSPCLEHEMSLENRPVRVHFPVGTLGDILAWFPYLERFRQRYRGSVTYTMAEEIATLFSDTYPALVHVQPDAPDDTLYASYWLGLFFDDEGHSRQPVDFRMAGLNRTAGNILGVDNSEARPNLKLDAPRTIAEPYVCIAVQASTQCKKWNNPAGWNDVVRHLKEKGYRVLCIDKDAVHGQTPAWTHLPREAEDFTGERPLAERAALLQHASAFVGVSSGLAWLAWACRIPTVLISGFTLPQNEFHTPYRVFNVHTCNGCWNDVRVRFDHHDFFWCPHHKGTPRQYECSALITSLQVIKQLDLALEESRWRQDAAHALPASLRLACETQP
ncbi:autotransporter strand-loop-strand O-heptosyltransferase [Paludibacterium paludis]|uniref:Autotransporter strand-loop-strand O-heptosyltransferase n=1 Tax=Paludibacterium paludis TaxID=1225769 RepID=A0A918P739_9NEIS|nr:autotransporter strand-loop-strand O-heptosyltransferase [Paludibacterium paludis]GGY28211.1 autotransporter strand-loop-strand O-heptosyltransferase [Paludibacterium paludis]